MSCQQDDNTKELNTCNSNGLLETFTTPAGEEIFIYEDGKLYTNDNGSCTFALQYFETYFLENNYVTDNSGTFLKEGGNLFPTKNNYIEDFENQSAFKDLFISSLSDTDLYWTNFTLQSPAAPEVSDYVALSECILDETCTFIDNKIELVNDPIDASNKVIKFTSVAPTANMITSKSSISSTINFYLKDADVWFQADYYIESGMPFSIVDFENTYFFQSPGPRVIIRNNKLEFENKFGAKLNIENNTGMTVPENQWFKLKVHLKYSNENNGIIELWQDETQIISATGINLPTSNSIQNILEVGVTASSEGCVLLFDNMRISETSF
jgi:hypothetical protein